MILFAKNWISNLHNFLKSKSENVYSRVVNGVKKDKCFEILTHMCFEQGNSVENGT